MAFDITDPKNAEYLRAINSKARVMLVVEFETDEGYDVKPSGTLSHVNDDGESAYPYDLWLYLDRDAVDSLGRLLTVNGSENPLPIYVDEIISMTITDPLTSIRGKVQKAHGL